MKYSDKTIPQLQWYEAVKHRPTMYVSQLNLFGFVNLVKRVIHEAFAIQGLNHFTFEWQDHTLGVIRFEEFSGPIAANWSRLEKNELPMHRNPALAILNAMSSSMEMCCYDKDASLLHQQEFRNGKLHAGNAIDQIFSCHSLVFRFELDATIWGDGFTWSASYILQELSTFSFLHKKKKIQLNYTHAKTECVAVLYNANGLKDCLTVALLNGKHEDFYPSYIVNEEKHFSIEIAFVIRPFIQTNHKGVHSYVNGVSTEKHGSHVEALLEGVLDAIHRFLANKGWKDRYTIRGTILEDYFLAYIHIQLENALFKGCIHQELDHPEIIQDIAQLVSAYYYQQLLSDEVKTRKMLNQIFR